MQRLYAHRFVQNPHHQYDGRFSTQDYNIAQYKDPWEAEHILFGKDTAEGSPQGERQLRAAMPASHH